MKPGDVLVLKTDSAFGQIAACEVGGGVVGYAADSQPDGCVDMWTMISRIGDCRILCRVAVAMGRSLLLTTDSPLLRQDRPYKRIEREGYAILCAK